MYDNNFSTAIKIFLVDYLKPFTPKSSNDPQAELKQPPFLVPKAVGEIYIPPGQVENEKYWFLLILEFLYINAEDPFGL
jgi:hypothetical protein